MLNTIKKWWNKTKAPTYQFEYGLNTDQISPNQTCIRILSGKYKNLLYYYDTIKFLENPNDTLTIKFTHIILNPKKNNERIEVTPELINVMGDILQEILKNNEQPQ